MSRRDQLQDGSDVRVRLTTDELDAVRKQAEASGLTATQWCRLVLRHAAGLPGFYDACTWARAGARELNGGNG